VSIRIRLTIWYTAVLAATLIAFGLLLYSLLSQTMHGQVDGELGSRAEQIASYIETQSNPLQMLIDRSVELPPVDVFSGSDIFVQILDLGGDVRARSANLGRRVMPIDQSSLDDTKAGSRVVYYTLVAGASSLRIYAAPLVVNDPLGGKTIIGSVQVGKSLDAVDGILKTVRYALILGIALTLVVAAGVGVLMARAALRPIDRITGTALKISRAADLSERLPPIRVRDEVGRLTDTFNEMLSRLQRLFEGQQRLVADVSHELRTPLTTLRGNLDLLRRGHYELGEDDVHEMLAAMEGETTRMSRLVSDLLLLAKADAGVSLDKVPVELDTVLLYVYRQATLMADGVTVQLGHEDQAVVLGDRDRLQQLLLNLTDNALKYTPAGGQVSLSLRHEDGWVKVAVTDTGVGIATEEQAHIFERFYRSDRDRSHERGGAGLGLSIARWIAEAHDGRLTVESEPRRGSTFTLWLRPYQGPAAGQIGEV